VAGCRVHRDVTGTRLLAVGHLRELKNFIGQPHGNAVNRDGEATRESADRGVAVVDELEDAVDRLVRVRQIDLAEDGGEPVVAARVTGEHGGQQLGRDFGEVGRGRRRNDSDSSDLHARVTVESKGPTPGWQFLTVDLYKKTEWFLICPMPSPELPPAADAERVPDDLAEAGVYPTSAAGFDHGLVVLAMGRPYWLVPSDAGFRLLVEPPALEATRAQLECFDRESIGWPPKPAAPEGPTRKTEFFTPLLGLSQSWRCSAVKSNGPKPGKPPALWTRKPCSATANGGGWPRRCFFMPTWGIWPQTSSVAFLSSPPCSRRSAGAEGGCSSRSHRSRAISPSPR